MKPGVIILALIATGSQAQTRHDPMATLMRDMAHMVLSDTQCLMVTLPGFDPHVLTPAQVARLHAVTINADPVGRPGLGSDRATHALPQALR